MVCIQSWSIQSEALKHIVAQVSTAPCLIQPPLIASWKCLGIAVMQPFSKRKENWLVCMFSRFFEWKSWNSDTDGWYVFCNRLNWPLSWRKLMGREVWFQQTPSSRQPSQLIWALTASLPMWSCVFPPQMVSGNLQPLIFTSCKMMQIFSYI